MNLSINTGVLNCMHIPLIVMGKSSLVDIHSFELTENTLLVTKREMALNYMCC